MGEITGDTLTVEQRGTGIPVAHPRPTYSTLCTQYSIETGGAAPDISETCQPLFDNKHHGTFFICETVILWSYRTVFDIHSLPQRIATKVCNWTGCIYFNFFYPTIYHIDNISPDFLAK